MTNPVEEATAVATARWRAFFNNGDAAGCASCYEEGAKMIAAPFGTFVGRAEIEAFWRKLIDEGFAEVEYVDPSIEVIDDQSAVLTSKWAMNKAHGIITRELWVLHPDGTALLREDHFEALE